MPAHRLTLRITRTFRDCKQTVKMHLITICKKTPIHRRVSTLQHKISIIVTAPNQTLSLTKHESLGLSSIHAIILSRTSRVLSVNFIRSVRTVLTLAPTAQRDILFSTALPSHVSTLTHRRVDRPRHVTIRQTSTRTAALPPIQRATCIITQTAGTTTLRQMLSTRSPATSVIFYHAHNNISRLDRLLASHNCRTRTLRNNLARSRHSGIVTELHSNTASLLVTASITTHNLSISRLARIFGCSLPISPRTCIRHVNQINQTNQANITIDLIRPHRQHLLITVRELLNKPVPAKHLPSTTSIHRLQLRHAQTSVATILSSRSNRIHVRNCHSIVRRVLRRRSTIRLLLTDITVTRRTARTNTSSRIRVRPIHRQDRGPPGHSGHTGHSISQRPKRGGHQLSNPARQLFISLNHRTNIAPNSLINTIAKRADLGNGSVNTVAIRSHCSLLRIPTSGTHGIIQRLRRYAVQKHGTGIHLSQL